MVRPVNEHDSLLLPAAVTALAEQTHFSPLDLHGSCITLDSGFDSEAARVMLRWYSFVPVIKPNKRRLKDEEKLEALYEEFNEPTYKKRFVIERTFAWADTYRKLAVRYEKLECTFQGFRYLAYTMINLRTLLGRNSL